MPRGRKGEGERPTDPAAGAQARTAPQARGAARESAAATPVSALWPKDGADRGVSQRELFRPRSKQSADRRRVAVSLLVAKPLASVESQNAL